MYHIERETKETVHQSKKHYTQFTPSEKFLLEQLVYSFKNQDIKISCHAKNELTLTNKMYMMHWTTVKLLNLI